jgi:hypothetical protein
MKKLEKYSAFVVATHWIVVATCSIHATRCISASWSFWAFDILLFLFFAILLVISIYENAFEMQVGWNVQMVAS